MTVLGGVNRIATQLYPDVLFLETQAVGGYSSQETIDQSNENNVEWSQSEIWNYDEWQKTAQGITEKGLKESG